MLKLSAQVELKHLEDPNRKMDYYQLGSGSSPWFETLAAAEAWVRRQEELRLENRQTPDTKWTYVRTKRVYVKVILDRHPLFLGQGCLPDWLRRKTGVLSLDTYWDNRCLFRSPMVMGFDGMAHLLHLGLMKFQRSLKLHGLMNHTGHLAIEKVVKNVVKGRVQIHGHTPRQVSLVQLVTPALVGRPRGGRCRSQGCFQWFPTHQLPALSPVPSCGGTP